MRTEYMFKKVREYTEMLDHATTPAEIGEALRMKRLYEDALLAQEEEEAKQ